MKASDGDLHTQRPRKRPGRAPVSCAECRRLKMRCDRSHPCENCTKRGCAAICPNGTLTTGKHNRMILTNTEELHDKIETLLERIRLLEDALRSLQSSVSAQPHPLLLNTPIEIQSPVVPVIRELPERHAVRPEPIAEEEEVFLDAFGTLSIGPDGETNYHGQTAQADYLLNESDSNDNYEFGRLPREFYSYTWPESPLPDNSIEDMVLSFLPDLNEARQLCEVYLNYTGWLCPVLSREILYEDLIAHVYHLPDRPWADVRATCPHYLALVFSIFSLGALFDPTRPAYNPESDDYYHLARVALSFKSAVLETTTNTVMAILHIAFYLDQCDSPQGHEQSWVMLGIASKLALSMGLHRDSSRWRLDKNTSQRRHSTFWQLYVMETVASLRLGRPPFLSEAFIDCPLPEDVGPQRMESNEAHPSYFAWTVHFVRLVRDIFQKAFGTKTPSYSVILALDRQVREFDEPQWPATQYALDSQHAPPLVKMQRWSMLLFKETVLLHLHRNFLVEALSSDPHGPLGSKYSHSIRACFESAYRLIEGLCWINHQCPEPVSKISSWFSASVSPAVVMCLLITRCPTSEFTRPAMEKLESVYSILQKASSTNRTAQKNLDATRRLRNMARAAVEASRLHISRNALSRQQAYLISADDDDVLDRCCGKTQVRVRRIRAPGPGPGAPRTRSSRVSFSPDGQASDEWDEHALSFNEGEAGSSSRGVDLSKSFGMTSSNLYATNTQGLDSTWHSLIQQLGF
ncbi:hypothetical protein M0805_008563 [Coniferiporia weirii]|nr:hypothetical protein M0805_008563 [Coniferiporia weirii]